MMSFFRRQKSKVNLHDLENVNAELQLRYFWLLVQSMEFDRKVRLTSIRLSKKYEKHQPWIV